MGLQPETWFSFLLRGADAAFYGLSSHTVFAPEVLFPGDQTAD